MIKFFCSAQVCHFVCSLPNQHHLILFTLHKRNSHTKIKRKFKWTLSKKIIRVAEFRSFYWVTVQWTAIMRDRYFIENSLFNNFKFVSHWNIAQNPQKSTMGHFQCVKIPKRTDKRLTNIFRTIFLTVFFKLLFFWKWRAQTA